MRPARLRRAAAAAAACPARSSRVPARAGASRPPASRRCQRWRRRPGTHGWFGPGLLSSNIWPASLPRREHSSESEALDGHSRLALSESMPGQILRPLNTPKLQT